jgi:5-methylcytosine-specific restriction enzyme subunit McrC
MHIELTEFTPRRLPGLTDRTAEAIYDHYRNQVEVMWPSPATEGCYELKAQGWVGVLPLPDGSVIRVHPKVPVASLFHMWEYAYQLDLLRDDADQLQSTDQVDAFFSMLAGVLARRVQARARRGLVRNYVSCADDLHTVRGRVDVMASLRQPARTALPCQFDEHTADVADNQLLAYSLRRILRSQALNDQARPVVMRAYRMLPHEVTAAPFRAKDCVDRLYSRLTEDYRQLHALCRFFLENTGPTHVTGDAAMLPFQVDMNRLFELFVAEWLRQNLPASMALTAQESVSLSEDNNLKFQIDLVIRDRESGRVLCVLDTKYKRHAVVSTSDMQQMIAYAASRKCEDAILIYPSVQTAERCYAKVPGFRVHTLVFDLAGDLEAAGWRLLARVLEIVGTLRVESAVHCR